MTSQQWYREKMNNVSFWSCHSPLRIRNYPPVKIEHCLKITDQKEKLFFNLLHLSPLNPCSGLKSIDKFFVTPPQEAGLNSLPFACGWT